MFLYSRPYWISNKNTICLNERAPYIRKYIYYNCFNYNTAQIISLIILIIYVFMCLNKHDTWHVASFLKGRGQTNPKSWRPRKTPSKINKTSILMLILLITLSLPPPPFKKYEGGSSFKIQFSLCWFKKKMYVVKKGRRGQPLPSTLRSLPLMLRV